MRNTPFSSITECTADCEEIHVQEGPMRPENNQVLQHQKKNRLGNSLLVPFVVASLIYAPGVWADHIEGLPMGPSVENGEVAVSHPDEHSLDVHASNSSVINWQSFNIAVGNAVNFIQPSATATALNNVIGGSISQIFGALNANGIVWLVNPAGINFGPTASINASSFLASTLQIATNNFLNQNYAFTRSPEGNGYIVNKGEITADNVTLMGDAVNNEGIIVAKLGKVTLASGEKMAVEMDSKGMISVAVEDPVTEAALDENGTPAESAVENSGSILADGGVVTLTTNVLEDIFQNAVNQEGLIQANQIEEKNGEIYVTANDRVHVGGEVSAIGGTVTVNSEGITSDGAITAANSFIDAHGGDTFLSGSVVGNASWTDTLHIFVVGNYSVTGNITLNADSDSNGTGVFEQKAGTKMSAGENVDISGADVYIANAFFGGDPDNFFNATAKSGEIKIGNYTDHIGGTYSNASYTGSATAVGDGKVVSAVGGLQTFSGNAVNPDGSGFIDEANPDTVNTSGNKFQVLSGAGTQKWGWVEFNISSLQLADNFVESGTATLLSSGGSAGKIANVYHAGDDWGGLDPSVDHTWNNQPTIDSGLLGGSGTIAVNNDPVIVNFTSELQQDLITSDSGLATLIVKRGDADIQVLEFWNDNAPATKNRPLLEITYYEIGLGDITLTANGNGAAKTDITLGRLVTKGNVTVDSKQGSILDANGDTLNVIAANNLLASAIKGIGSSNSLETSVHNLSAKNTTTGNIVIDNFGDVDLENLGSLGGIINTAPGGAIGISAASSLAINAPVETTGGDITLSASENIIQNATGNIKINQTDSSFSTVPTNVGVATGDLHTTGDWQFGISNDNTVGVQWQLPASNTSLADYTATAGGNYTMTGTTAVTTNGGDATITANGNVALTLVDASNGNVAVTATTGNITDADGGTAPGDYDVKARTITFSAPLGTVGGAASPGPGNIDLGYPTNTKFSYEWSTGDGTDLDAVTDAFTGPVFSAGGWIFSTVSPALADSNNWFFYILSIGSVSPTVPLGTFFIDTTLPVISAGAPIGTAGDNGWWVSDLEVPFSATDNLSGFSGDNPDEDLDTVLPSEFTSGEGANVEVTSAGAGVCDQAGNCADDKTVGFKIDLFDPEVIATIVTNGGVPQGLNDWFLTDVNSESTASDTEEGSGIDTSTYQFRIDGGAWTPYTSPDDVNVSTEDSHLVEFRVSDFSGREGTADTSFKIDLFDPEVIATIVTNGGVPNGIDGTFIPSVDSESTASDTEEGSGIDEGTYQFRIDGGEWTPYTSPDDINVPDVGEHLVEFRVQDFSGREGEANTSFTIALPPTPVPPATGLPFFSIINDELRFRIPNRSTTDTFQISHIQGSPKLTAPQVLFYHPIVVLTSYEIPVVGAEVYEFINGNITVNNPALLPVLGLGEDEAKKKKKP